MPIPPRKYLTYPKQKSAAFVMRRERNVFSQKQIKLINSFFDQNSEYLNANEAGAYRAKYLLRCLPCSLVYNDRHFKGTSCLRYQTACSNILGRQPSSYSFQGERQTSPDTHSYTVFFRDLMSKTHRTLGSRAVLTLNAIFISLYSLW
jgi:hypothetical protein